MKIPSEEFWFTMGFCYSLANTIKERAEIDKPTNNSSQDLQMADMEELVERLGRIAEVGHPEIESHPYYPPGVS